MNVDLAGFGLVFLSLSVIVLAARFVSGPGPTRDSEEAAEEIRLMNERVLGHAAVELRMLESVRELVNRHAH